MCVCVCVCVYIYIYIYFPILVCQFILLKVSFDEQKILILKESNLCFLKNCIFSGFNLRNICQKKKRNICPLGTSLVVHWLRIHLPMQGTGFDPWSRKIPNGTEQLSPCATATEPAL